MRVIALRLGVLQRAFALRLAHAYFLFAFLSAVWP